MINMSEDDTFKLLRRTPFAVMNKLFNKFIDNGDELSLAQMSSFLYPHGWTIEEYNREEELAILKDLTEIMSKIFP